MNRANLGGSRPLRQARPRTNQTTVSQICRLAEALVWKVAKALACRVAEALVCRVAEALWSYVAEGR